MKIEYLIPVVSDFDVRVVGSGQIIFSAKAAIKHGLRDKKIRLALDQDDEEKKFLYVAILPPDTESFDAVDLRYYPKNGTTILQNKVLAEQILCGAKKATMKFSTIAKVKGDDLLVFEITRHKE
jgi:hypothetical protein